MKPIILAAGGAVLGIVIAAAVFFLFFKGGGEATAAPTKVIAVPGKMGPRLVLADRVINLASRTNEQKYLKVQTVVEFETTDPRWEWVLTGCNGKQPKAPVEKHAADDRVPSEAMVSAAPVAAVPVASPAAEGAAESPCEVAEKELLAEFEHHIGTGRQLIEDTITTVVSARTWDEVATPQGKEALKAEIAKRISDLIGEPHVSRVLFTNFIYQ